MNHSKDQAAFTAAPTATEEMTAVPEEDADEVKSVRCWKIDISPPKPSGRKVPKRLDNQKKKASKKKAFYLSWLCSIALNCYIDFVKRCLGINRWETFPWVLAEDKPS